MRTSRSARTLTSLAFVAMGVGIGTACTHDFDAFDPNVNGAGSEGGAASDAQATATEASAGDSATAIDGNVDAGCTAAAASWSWRT